MSRAIRLMLLLLLFTLFLGGCHFMIIDSASPNPQFPPYPISMYSIGRFVLPVPTGLRISSSVVRINKIEIQEMLWKKDKDRQEYFNEVWKPIRTAAWENYVEGGTIGPSTQGGWAEEDISHLCGYPAMLLCYSSDMADHLIDVHIGLPEVILRLQESRFYDLGQECLDMEGPILDLLKHYRFGYRNVAPDSFFSAGGRVEGLKSWSERTGIALKRPSSGSSPEMYLRFDTFMDRKPGQPPRRISVTSGIASKYGIGLKILRSRNRELAGMNGLEEVYIMTDTDGENPELTASWEYEGAGNDPQKPRIELELECPAQAREEALRMWDAIMTGFTTVRQYYGAR